MNQDSFGARSSLQAGGDNYEFFRVSAVPGSADLPFSLKVLLENLLRHEDGVQVTPDDIAALGSWDPLAKPSREVQFAPSRVLMQDFTGVPCVVDLATMRDEIVRLGGDPATVDPLSPVELVIDHSVVADYFGSPDALARNMHLEYQRNRERYQFLKWGQGAFDNLSVVPPGAGIVHQVNIERLARVVDARMADGRLQAFPDTCVGTDSHTTMVGGLGVLGWGVGGIEAEAVMLGQPTSMLIPRVIGVKLTGALPVGTTATDLVLTVTQLLRAHGVVGAFVEFYGEGVAAVPVADRATLANMSPEYGSTVAIFPIDAATLDYLRLTGRDEAQVALVEAYAKRQGLWHDPSHEARYSERLELDLGSVVPSIAGPKRPQDRIDLAQAKRAFAELLPSYTAEPDETAAVVLGEQTERIGHGAVVLAAITSCTNTSNPSVMVGAGLLAKKAVARGLTSKPWVKTTLGPGSQVVTGYLERAGLMTALGALGFDLVGYGCTACIGNAGPLMPEVSRAVNDRDLAVAAVLSGNRNFEGRINPDVKLNYLASPPLVVAYALAGRVDIDFAVEPIGQDADGRDVFLADIWPGQVEIDQTIAKAIDPAMFRDCYADVFDGGEEWQSLPTPQGAFFHWDDASTYIRKAPYFDHTPVEPEPVCDIDGARVLLKLGDSVTTDHISPAGAIKAGSPAGRYLTDHGVAPADFNTYGSRRGNHEVMVRGTFANIRLRNQLAPGTEGGYTRDFSRPGGPVTTVYEAAMAYQAAGTPLVVLAGREYGSGSSRDWAAKGTALLGVRAVIAQSYERIHRSNLIGMGVLPLEFLDGEDAAGLGLTGLETLSIVGIDALNDGPVPETVLVVAQGEGHPVEFDVRVRIDTPGEADYFRHGGIMPYVLRSLAARA